MQKSMGLSSLNRYVFVQLFSVKIFLKCASVFFPQHTVRHEGKSEIPSHSAMNKKFNMSDVKTI